MFTDRMLQFNRILLAALIGSVLILSSCTFPGVISQTAVPPVHSKEKVILFFSDEKKIEEEEQYYDALLAIKDKYPAEYKKMRIYQEEQKNPYGVSTYPALMIMENHEIVVRIEGIVNSKDEILAPIKKALSP
ncbi:hypothetical protein ACQCVE_15105 [Metabacillus sp. 113a]|uniref:hypothetical protein n=1 Tax=Metabacillus sp. 113a TaxID=3404706 RepID=UPI003CFB7079